MSDTKYKVLRIVLYWNMKKKWKTTEMKGMKASGRSNAARRFCAKLQCDSHVTSLTETPSKTGCVEQRTYLLLVLAQRRRRGRRRPPFWLALPGSTGRVVRANPKRAARTERARRITKHAKISGAWIAAAWHLRFISAVVFIHRLSSPLPRSSNSLPAKRRQF